MVSGDGIMKVGDVCYFIENNYRITQALVTYVAGDFCTLKYGSGRGIRLRTTRLYKSKEEAQEALPAQALPRRRANPYLYMH